MREAVVAFIAHLLRVPHSSNVTTPQVLRGREISRDIAAYKAHGGRGIV